MKINGSDIPSILGSVGTGAMAGMSIAGPIGAIAGGLIAGGVKMAKSNAQNNPSRVYVTQNDVLNKNPYGGIIQGLPGAKRTQNTNMYEEQSKASKGWDVASSITDTAASTIYSMAGANTETSPLEDITTNDIEINTGMNTNIKSDRDWGIRGSTDFALDSRLKNDQLKYGWDQLMKRNIKKSNPWD